MSAVAVKLLVHKLLPSCDLRAVNYDFYVTSC